MSRPAFDVIAVDVGGTLATGPYGPAGDRPIDIDAAAALHRLAITWDLAVSSNTKGSRRPALQAAGVEELFCAVIESHDLGVAKPERAFYQALIDAVACPPHRVLHVGNRLDNDVLVPVAMGMRAVYVCPYANPGVRLPAGVLHVRRFADLPAALRTGAPAARRDRGPRPAAAAGRWR